jgi:hypothetical protein
MHELCNDPSAVLTVVGNEEWVMICGYEFR